MQTRPRTFATLQRGKQRGGCGLVEDPPSLNEPLARWPFVTKSALVRIF